MDLIGFVGAVCTLSIVIVCPARKCGVLQLVCSKQPLAPSKARPAKLSRILTSW